MSRPWPCSSSWYVLFCLVLFSCHAMHTITITKKTLQRASFLSPIQIRYDTSLRSINSETPSSVYEKRSKLLERALQVLKVLYGEFEAETATIRQQLSNNSINTNTSGNNGTSALEEQLRNTQTELMETRTRLESRDQLWLEAKEKIIVVLNEASRLRSINKELNDNLTESQALVKESQLAAEELKVTIAALMAEKDAAQEEVEQMRRNHAVQESERQSALLLSSPATAESSNQLQQQNQEFMQQAASLIATVAEQRASGVDYLIASDLKEQRKILQRQCELLESLMDKVSSIDSSKLINAAVQEETAVEEFVPRKKVVSSRPSSDRDGNDNDYLYNNYNEDGDRDRDNYRSSKSRRAELGRRSGRFVRGVGEFAGIVVKSTVDILGFWVGLGVLDDNDDDDDDDETEADRKRRNWTPANVVSPQALPVVERGPYPIEDSEDNTVFPEKFGQTDNYSRYYQNE